VCSAMKPWLRSILLLLLAAPASAHVPESLRLNEQLGFCAAVLVSLHFFRQHRLERASPFPLPPAATARQRGESDGGGGKSADPDAPPSLSPVTRWSDWALRLLNRPQPSFEQNSRPQVRHHRALRVLCARDARERTVSREM